MIRPRPEWPLALRDFLVGRQETNTHDIAHGALYWPAGFPLNHAINGWITAALGGLGWRRESVKSQLWKAP
jgi:membrane-associated phospholipid phosphatase